MKKAKQLLFSLLFLAGVWHSASAQTCNIVPTFTYTNMGNGQISFSCTGSASGLASYTWRFGDGFNNMNDAIYIGSNTVTHTYNNGNYNLWLKLTLLSNPYCRDSSMQSIAVSNNTCSAKTTYTLQKILTQSFTWQALVNYPTNITSVSWDWGDGNSSTGLFPSHTYSSTGSYNICMSTTASCGATYQYCMYPSLYKSSGANQILNISVASGPVGIATEALDANAISVYPNPAHAQFIVKHNLVANYDLELRNLLGQIIPVNINESSDGKVVNTQELAPGIYLLSINSNLGNTVKRIVIN